MNTPEPTLSFDDALNITLQALLQERQSLESCLEQYPHYAAELKPLLQTALLTQRMKKPVMSEARVAALEERLMLAFPAAPAQAEDDPPTMPVRRPVIMFPAWMSRSAAIVALVFLAALGTGGGTVAASANSVPGETLYSVKRAWEDVILFLASLIGRMNEMQMHLAYVRWEELEALSQREQPISDGLWQGFVHTFKDAYQAADPQAQRDLIQVLAAVETAPNTAVLPAAYRADLIAIVGPRSPEILTLQTPAATQEAAATESPVETATSVITPVPTEALLVASTPTAFNVIVATVTRTPTPSRTPTATFTPIGTPTPLTPLPSPTATYTRLPLAIPSQTPVIPTPPDADSTPDVTGPGEVLPPPDQGGGNKPTVPPIVGTFDPIIRPTMRSVYATQTALASGAEQSPTPEMP